MKKIEDKDGREMLLHGDTVADRSMQHEVVFDEENIHRVSLRELAWYAAMKKYENVFYSDGYLIAFNSGNYRTNIAEDNNTSNEEVRVVTLHLTEIGTLLYTKIDRYSRYLSYNLHNGEASITDSLPSMAKGDTNYCAIYPYGGFIIDQITKKVKEHEEKENKKRIQEGTERRGEEKCHE